MSDPAVCLPESKEFPNKRGRVLTESLQGGLTCACLDSSGSFSDWHFFSLQEEVAEWIIASVLGLAALNSE